MFCHISKVLGVAMLAAASFTVNLATAHVAELPRAHVNTTIPAVSGRSISVPAGGDLQAAIDAAKPGDEILLAAGATYTGAFKLPNKGPGTGWITIRTNGLLPSVGTRITAEDAATMAKLVAPGNEPALRTEAGAHHYYLIGLEITAASRVKQMSNLIRLGEGGSAQKTKDAQPHHLVLDRLYVHGTDTLDLRRGIALNSAYTAIVNSHISDVHSRDYDSQAIAGWNGTGPYLIENNYLEGAGENLMFGGADPQIPNALPSDIEIRGNHFYKPLGWQGRWLVKNLLELKIGQRVLIEGNHFENNWVDGQSGFAILLKSSSGATAPWSQTSDVTFRDNIVRHSPGGLNIAAHPDPYDAVPAARFVITNNIFDGIGEFGGTKNGRLFQLLGANAPLEDVIITHNTAVHNTQVGATITFDGGPTERLVFRKNIVTRGEYGIKGSGTAEGAATLSTYAPGAVLIGNVLVSAPAESYGTYAGGNSFPATLAEVGFIDPAHSDFRLRPLSPFIGAGADERLAASMADLAPH